MPKDYQLQEAQEQLDSVKAELEQLGLNVDTEVRLGDSYTEILDATLEFDISAILMST